MVKKKTWQEFRKTGLLWFMNTSSADRMHKDHGNIQKWTGEHRTGRTYSRRFYARKICMDYGKPGAV